MLGNRCSEIPRFMCMNPSKGGLSVAPNFRAMAAVLSWKAPGLQKVAVNKR